MILAKIGKKYSIARNVKLIVPRGELFSFVKLLQFAFENVSLMCKTDLLHLDVVASLMNNNKKPLKVKVYKMSESIFF